MTKALSPRAVFAGLLLLVTCVSADACAGSAPPAKPTGALSAQDALPKVLRPGPGYANGHPKNPETWYILAEWLSEQAKDVALPQDQARTLVLRGLDVNEQALTLNPVYYEALGLKSVLLRQRAVLEKSSSLRRRLIAEADGYRVRAAEIAERMREGQ
jgi:hypothetical protein